MGRRTLLLLCKEQASASTLIQADRFSWAERELLLVCKAGVYRRKSFQIFLKSPEEKCDFSVKLLRVFKHEFVWVNCE